MLRHLHDSGPSSVTELLNLAEINHLQLKKSIADLITNHLIILKPITEIALSDGNRIIRRGRRPTKSLEKQILKLNKLNSNVKFLITITPLGEKYLAKMNKLQNMLQWVK